MCKMANLQIIAFIGCLFAITGQIVLAKKNEGVIFTTPKNKGIITLNRPTEENYFTNEEMQTMNLKISKWNRDKKLIMIKGAGDDFSKGIQIGPMIQGEIAGVPLYRNYLKTFSDTSITMATLKIPSVILINGQTTGGSVALSVYGRYRVVTERTTFAVKEASVGFRVLGSDILMRLQGKVGLYLALTGYTLNGADMMRLGMATHYCESKSLPLLEKEIVKSRSEWGAKRAMDKCNIANITTFSLEPYLKQINNCFAGATAEEIVARLTADGSKWANETLATINLNSPTATKVIIKQFQVGASMNQIQILNMQYILGLNVLDEKEILEGIRAVLLDKDFKPKWNFATLAEVTDAYVDNLFRNIIKLP